MADTNKKVSELETASQVNNTDLVMLSQGSAGSGFASLKTTILAIAQKIVTGINFTSDLQTESKTIAGAINEVASGSGGSSTFAGLSDVDIDDTTLANGQVPKWNSTTEKWENGNAGGGSGGHTILDDSGTSLAQEDDLQFKGTYSEDDSTNGKTVVNITREMPQAQFDLLSANEKKGIIRITDDDYVCDSAEVKYSEGVSVKDKLDTIKGTFTAGANVTIGSRNFWRKQGNFVYSCIVLSITANVSANSVLLSSADLDFVNNSYLYARKEDGSIEILTCNGHNIITEFGISSGTVLRIGTVVFSQ